MSFVERFQIRQDTLAGKIPKRVFVAPSFTVEAACGFAKIPLAQAHYDRSLVEKAYTAVCEAFYSDTHPCMDLRYPAVYQILGAKNWILGSNGAVQHPEIETMLSSEYDELTAEPYKFIIEKLLPRVCTSLNTDPINSAITLAKANSLYAKISGAEFGIVMGMSQKYGYAPGFITGQLIEAPFDFIADQMRGFKGINMDVRRIPDKIEAAVEALTPLIIKLSKPTVMRPGILNFIPLHLAPYLRPKDFDRLYWPTLEKVVVEMDKLGMGASLFAEQDWTRFAEYLERLPESSVIWFEDGDYKKIKETVGKKHVISGFYDPTHTLVKTKEECIDEVKRLIDVCAPEGRFYFGFNRGIMDINSVNVPNLQAVLEWVYANTNY